jgi:hypothetical protein
MTLTDFLLARIVEDEALHCEWGCHERVLAECEAKRRIVENASRHAPGQRGYGASNFAAQCIALPYRNHPDYKQEWKP